MVTVQAKSTLRNIVVLKALFVTANVVGPFASLFFQRQYLLNSSEVALVITLISVFYLMGNLAGGLLVERYSFRRLLVGASGCSFCFLLFALMICSDFIAVTMILVSMFFSGLVVPIFSILISLLVNDRNRVASFGYLHLASNVGAVFVFVVGGYLLSLNGSYLLLFSIVVGFLCLLFSRFLALPECIFRREGVSRSSIIALFDVPRIVIVAGVIFFVLSMLDAQREYQLPLWLEHLTFREAATVFGATGMVNALLVILLTRWVVFFSSRYSPISNLSFAAVFYGVGFGAYAVVEQLAFILVFVFFWTLGEILGVTYVTALISQKAHLRVQAKLFSLIPVLQAGARIVSVGMAAHFINLYGFHFNWIFYGSMGIFFGAISLLFYRWVCTGGETSSMEKS